MEDARCWHSKGAVKVCHKLIPKSSSSAKDRNLREDLQNWHLSQKNHQSQLFVWSDRRKLFCIFFPDLSNSPNTFCICRLVSPVRSPRDLTLLAPLASPRSCRKAFTSCFLLPSKAVATFCAVLVEMPFTWQQQKRNKFFRCHRCRLFFRLVVDVHLYLLSI